MPGHGLSYHQVISCTSPNPKIENDQIVLEIVGQGPEDPQCCPSLKVRKTYAVQNGQLAEVGSS